MGTNRPGEDNKWVAGGNRWGKHRRAAIAKAERMEIAPALPVQKGGGR